MFCSAVHSRGGEEGSSLFSLSLSLPIESSDIPKVPRGNSVEIKKQTVAQPSKNIYSFLPRYLSRLIFVKHKQFEKSLQSLSHRESFFQDVAKKRKQLLLSLFRGKGNQGARALMSRLSFLPPEATGRGEKECSLRGVWALVLVFGRRGEEGLFMGGKGHSSCLGTILRRKESGGKKEKVFFSSVMFPRGGKRMRKMKKSQDEEIYNCNTQVTKNIQLII